MGGRSLFLHAGLHKTGTTALQSALAPNPNWIADRGYRFPLTGRPYGAGHHNIAWEITHDRRFRAEYGTIRELIAEVHDGDYNVILSSEDFTGALAHADRFQEFVNSLKEVFPDICLILFLRNQVDYATSLYLELLAHGFDGTFESFLNESVQQGAFRWREWCYPFNFQEFLSGIGELEGIRMKVCSYDVNKTAALLGAFLEACELPPEGSEPTSLGRENTRRSAGWYVAQFLSNRNGSSLDQAQSLISGHVQQAWGNKWIVLSAADHRFIANNLKASNEWVSERYGVPINRFMDAVLSPGRSSSNDLAISNLFSTEFQELFADSSLVLRNEMDTANAVLESERDRLRGERNEAVATNHRLAEQCGLLTADLEAARNRGEASTADLAIATTAAAALTLERDTLAAQLTMAETVATALTRERDTLAAQLNTARAARDELALEREFIIESRSWKLTAPLRELMLLPGFRKAKASRRA